MTDEKFTATEEALCAAVLAKYPDVIVEPDEYMGRFFWGFQLDDPAFYVPENPQPGIDYGCDDKMRDPVAIFAGVREAIVGGELWVDLLDRDEYPEGIEP